VLLQAAGFAVRAALSPTALLITAIYLGSARPRTTALCYLAGAVLMSTVTGIVVLLVLRAGHFQYRNHQAPRYGLRLGLGLLILAAGAVVARRKPRPPDPSRPGGGDPVAPGVQPGAADRARGRHAGVHAGADVHRLDPGDRDPPGPACRCPRWA